MSTRRAKLTPYSEIKRERVEWLEPGRVPLGALTIIAGLPGLGKSQWTIGLAGRLSRGELPCGEATAILATAEDSAGAVVKPRLLAVQADIERVVEVTIALDEDTEDGISLPADTAELEESVMEEGARLVVVDPLVAFLGGSVDSWKDAGVRQALAPLAALAARQGCAVVGVMHPNKSMGTDWYMRLSGSGGFGGAARSVLVLGQAPDDAEDGNQRVLAAVKNNYAPLAPSLLYEIEPILLPAEGDEPEVETSRLTLIGESEHDGRALLRVRDDEEEGSAASEAERFLLDMLATGPVAADEVKREAKSAGIGDRALTKARNALGIRMPDGIKRVGGIAGQGHWTWQIPKYDTAKNDDPITENVILSANPLENVDSSDEGPLRNTVSTNGSLSAQEEAVLRDRVARELLAQQEAERAARDARLREQGDVDYELLGTGRLDEIERLDERGEL